MLFRSRIRLNKELDRIKNEIARADGKLLNKNFVAKAPKKLVEDERAKKEKYLDMKEKIEKQLLKEPVLAPTAEQYFNTTEVWKQQGGYKFALKQIGENVDNIIQLLNEQLYIA